MATNRASATIAFSGSMSPNPFPARTVVIGTAFSRTQRTTSELVAVEEAPAVSVAGLRQPPATRADRTNPASAIRLRGKIAKGGVELLTAFGCRTDKPLDRDPGLRWPRRTR